MLSSEEGNVGLLRWAIENRFYTPYSADITNAAAGLGDLKILQVNYSN